MTSPQLRTTDRSPCRMQLRRAPGSLWWTRWARFRLLRRQLRRTSGCRTCIPRCRKRDPTKGRRRCSLPRPLGCSSTRTPRGTRSRRRCRPLGGSRKGPRRWRQRCIGRRLVHQLRGHIIRAHKWCTREAGRALLLLSVSKAGDAKLDLWKVK